MNPLQEMGRMLLVFGVLMVVIGLVLLFGSKLPFSLGRLPGDIVIRKGNFTFFFPLATCALLSLVLTLILSLLFRR